MLLADLVLHGPLRSLDEHVLAWTTPVRPGWRTGLATWTAAAGHWSLQGGLLMVAASVVAWRRRTPTPVLTSATALLLLALIGTALKELMGRTGPQQGMDHLFAGSRAWPSGHAAGAVVVGLVGARVVGEGRSRTARRMVQAVGLGWAALVGWSRIQIAVHWSTDVLAGWLLGLLVVALTGLVLGLGHRSDHHASGQCGAGLAKFFDPDGSRPPPGRTSHSCSAAPSRPAPGRPRNRAPGAGDPR